MGEVLLEGRAPPGTPVPEPVLIRPCEIRCREESRNLGKILFGRFTVYACERDDAFMCLGERPCKPRDMQVPEVATVVRHDDRPGHRGVEELRRIGRSISLGIAGCRDMMSGTGKECPKVQGNVLIEEERGHQAGSFSSRRASMAARWR